MCEECGSILTCIGRGPLILGRHSAMGSASDSICEVRNKRHRTAADALGVRDGESARRGGLRHWHGCSCTKQKKRQCSTKQMKRHQLRVARSAQRGERAVTDQVGQQADERREPLAPPRPHDPAFLQRACLGSWVLPLPWRPLQSCASLGWARPRPRPPRGCLAAAAAAAAAGGSPRGCRAGCT